MQASSRRRHETAAAYANQAFTKPGLAHWGDAAQSEYAIGFICDLGAPGLRFICRRAWPPAHRPRTTR